MNLWRAGASFSFILLAVASLARAATPAIDAGGAHSIALKADGTLLTWGDDSAGQLGIGRTLGSTTASRVSGLGGVTAIAAGYAHVVALKSDGTVWTWGDNADAELGDGTTAGRATPAQVPGLSGMTRVAAGSGFSVALKSDGTVWTWGVNYRGQLGYDGDGRGTPGVVDGLSNVIEISAGYAYVLALKSDGTVWAWGANDEGQLGDGTRTELYTGRATPTAVRGLSGVDAISAGGAHALARKTEGSVWAWGNNSGGRLGDGTLVDRLIPVQVLGLSGVAMLSAGGEHSVVARNDGSVWVWGSSGYGQLGDDTYTDSPVPKPLSGLTDVVSVSAGFLFSIAVRRDGSYYAWGHGDNGELGDGTHTHTRTIPILVAGPGGLAATAVGASFAVARTVNGNVYAWGDDSYGQLGDAVYTFRSAPAPLAAIPGVTAISAGGKHTLALKDDGTVLAWGDNSARELGDDSASRSTPAPVAGVSGITAVSAGGLHSLALKSDGTVLGWGDNYNGQLGDGTNDSHFSVAQITGVANVTAIAAGGGHSVFLIRDGTVVAVGANTSGQLGDGSTTDRYRATVVSGISDVRKIAAGDNHTLALTSDRSVWAWGSNASGELGDGTLTDRSVPVRVQGISDVVEIAAGGSFSLARKADGTVWAWGANYFFQLGDGTGEDHWTPAPVSVPDGFVAISAGDSHAIALRGDGSVFTWGRSKYGQLGDGTLIDRDTPVVAVRENGAGTIAGNDWFLDLDPAAPSTIPADRVPVFQLVVSGQASQLNADLRFRSQDVNTVGSVFVFALAPAAIVKNARASKDGGCVLAQVDANGQLVAASASTLQPFTTGVLSSQGQAVAIVNATQTGQAAGATFFVGYGATSNAMVANGTNRSAVSVPGAEQCPDTLAAANTPAALSGLFWNANESGWGIHFTQRGSNVFAAWYTYDTSGNPKWYVSTCAMNGGATGTTGTCNGALFEVNGPTFFTPPFNTSLVHATNAGNLQVTFQNADNASMTYSGVAGQTRTVAITRQPLSAGAAPAIDYTDIWWGGASESGWGMAITQQSSTMFLAWYVYDNSAKPMWYVATCTLSGTTCSGSLLRTTGPNFGPTFNANQVQVFTAGTVGVSFSDGSNATLTYTVNGVSASKTITRQLF